MIQFGNNSKSKKSTKMKELLIEFLERIISYESQAEKVISEDKGKNLVEILLKEKKEKKFEFITAILRIETNCKNCKRKVSVSVNEDDLYEYDEYLLKFFCGFCEFKNSIIIQHEELP